jgi:5-formyltetrahydrofolate cyclo-ligase
MKKLHAQKKSKARIKEKEEISKAVEEFHSRTMMQQICSNLQDALRYKEKSLGLQCELELEVKRRQVAEDALREGRLISKRLKDQVNYYKNV